MSMEVFFYFLPCQPSNIRKKTSRRIILPEQDGENPADDDQSYGYVVLSNKNSNRPIHSVFLIYSALM